MVLPLYRYEVADLSTGNVLGDLPLNGVRYGKKLNDSGVLSGSFVVEPRLTPQRAVEDPYDWTMPAKRTLTVYRDERPVWGGIIWTSNYSSANGVVQIGAGDYWSYFDHRMVLPVLALVDGSYGNKVAPSGDYIATQGVTFAAVEQLQIARDLVELAQAHTGGDIGIELDGTLSSGIDRDREYDGFDLSTVGQALRNLANTLDGPDLLFDVVGVDAMGRPIRRLLQGEPLLGVQGSPHVFEYGANLVDYTWARDGSGMITREFATGDGTAEGTPIAVSEDVDAYTVDGGGFLLLESEHQWSGVSELDTLQDHADSQQSISARPLATPHFIVRGDMAPTVGEWSIGDDAVAVIEDDFFPRGMEATVR
ncbi:MAG TPA: hypothetical protein VNO31_04515, partial [Umezawaea sp.]|nr:hypothetical protein [Umezawaea sp.]